MTISKNEILTALNKPDEFILAIVEVADVMNETQSPSCTVYYVRQPFQREPDFGVTSVNYDVGQLEAQAELMT